MTVSIFHYFGVISQDNIDEIWMYIDQVLILPALTKFKNNVLSLKDVAKESDGNQWTLGQQ